MTITDLWSWELCNPTEIGSTNPQHRLADLEMLQACIVYNKEAVRYGAEQAFIL